MTNPKFGAGPDIDGNKVGDYIGAQTTVQRWWADPLLNTRGKDRTLRTVFTHDHFGPSSHQHHGFYGALVVEKAQSTWTALNGTPLGGGDDGGPTSFAANIIDRDFSDGTDDSFREFNLAFADFAIVYRGFDDPMPVNPPGRKEAALPIAIEPTKDPRPEAISAATPAPSSSTIATSPSRTASRRPTRPTSTRSATRAVIWPTPSARAYTATRSRRCCRPTSATARSCA